MLRFFFFSEIKSINYISSDSIPKNKTTEIFSSDIVDRFSRLQKHISSGIIIFADAITVKIF